MRNLLAILVPTLTGAFGTTAHAEILYVCQDNCEYSSIAAAISAASDGDTIQLTSETYEVTESINLQGKAVRIIGISDTNGDPLSIIDGQGTTQVFVCNSGEESTTIFDTMTITNGYSPSGETGGGAVLVDSSSPSFFNCHFIDNTSDLWAGAVGIFQTATGPTQPSFTNCLFQGNTAGAGGGIAAGLFTQPAISTCTFDGNTAIQGGAVFFTGNSSTNIANSTFTNNTARANGPGESPDGGAIYTAGVTLTACTLSGNVPDAVFNFTTGLKGAPIPVRLVDTVICGNTDGKSTAQVTGIMEHVGDTRIHPRCEDAFDLGDVDGDGDVDRDDWEQLGADLGICVGDLNGDGRIDAADLGLLIGAWGVCP